MPKPLVNFEESNSYYMVKVSKPSLKYIDFFLKLSFSGELLNSRFFPNAKEISETQGVFVAALHKLNLDYKSEDILAIVVGDGFAPRTGYYISYLTKWSVISVDPNMKRDFEKIENPKSLFVSLSLSFEELIAKLKFLLSLSILTKLSILHLRCKRGSFLSIIK